mmetsp:Transcript_89851/g.240075  ORF Transcript_89851/g.240075 Transcript_89851/m.240075 type:complete len:629 (+) Transcript_89851:97-1983(+)
MRLYSTAVKVHLILAIVSFTHASCASSTTLHVFQHKANALACSQCSKPSPLGSKRLFLKDGTRSLQFGSFGNCRLRGGAADAKPMCDVPGPTTRPLSQTIKSQTSFSSEKYLPTPSDAASNVPLSDLVSLLQAQESVLMMQASRCRAAAQRLLFIQQLLYTKVYGKGGEPKNRDELEDEIRGWKAATYEMHRGLSKCINSAGSSFAELLGEPKLVLPELSKASEFYAGIESDVTTERHSEEDEDVAVAKKTKKISIADGVDGPTTKIDRKRAFDSQMLFTPDIEAKYRVATWHGLAVYGAIADKSQTIYEYPGDTELHIVWDIDQSKLVGEGTNDVELVIKCVLWWKEELQHDPGFIPAVVPEQIRNEFRDYCAKFDLEQAFKSVMHLLLRPKIRDFVKQHSQAKWWTFTNKDREVDGQIVRDVSDEDGLVGKFQPNVHEVSGKPVVDANKYALQVLDECANQHAGIVSQERPIIGVRGQRKDLGRVAKLIQAKRLKEGSTESKPVTVILLDDRKQDAYGNCQANDPRILCPVPGYQAITPEQGVELVNVMEKILPVDTLLKFYKAFRAVDPAHALVQCVEIMSDDQSMLLKRIGSGENTRFEYRPKVSSSQQLPPLPVFKRVVCRAT